MRIYTYSWKLRSGASEVELRVAATSVREARSQVLAFLAEHGAASAGEDDFPADDLARAAVSRLEPRAPRVLIGRG